MRVCVWWHWVLAAIWSRWKRKPFVTRGGSPSADTWRGKINATKSLHRPEIIVVSLVHCSPIIIKPYRLQHQVRSVHLIAARSIQAQGTQWKEEISLFRETTATTGAPRQGDVFCPALLLCLAMLINYSDCWLNKSCHKARVCSRPHLSELVTALGPWHKTNTPASLSAVTLPFSASTSTAKFPVFTVYTHFSYIYQC